MSRACTREAHRQFLQALSGGIMKNTRSATYGRIGLRRLGACFGIAAWAFAACTQPIDLEDAPPPPGDDDTAPVDVAWPDAEIPSNAEARSEERRVGRACGGSDDGVS